MTGRKLLIILCWAMFSLPALQKANAQVSYKKTYWGNTIEIGFATALLSNAVKNDKITPLRVSNVFNIAFTLNHDFSKALGMYTGAGIKNIGFIEKAGADSTVKRRAYCLEVPLGLNIGSLYRRRYVTHGGGADLAFNYKEKGFVKRGDKQKFNEWFSDRTPLVMPFVFAGFSFNPGLVLKLQYYPQNFLNTGFINESGVKPYAGYNVNLFILSVGVDIHHHTPPAKVVQSAKGMM